MNKNILLEKTLQNIRKLPESKIKEISDFTEFLLGKIEDQMITEGIQNILTGSKSFDFLKDEEDIYTKDDLKEVYH